tara:strand:+ start:1578 stop:2156 length:579 start_codon:yes stop_codon:yes gene_type:complete
MAKLSNETIKLTRRVLKERKEKQEQLVQENLGAMARKVGGAIGRGAEKVRGGLRQITGKASREAVEDVREAGELLQTLIMRARDEEDFDRVEKVFQSRFVKMRQDPEIQALVKKKDFKALENIQSQLAMTLSVLKKNNLFQNPGSDQLAIRLDKLADAISAEYKAYNVSKYGGPVNPRRSALPDDIGFGPGM